MRIYFIRHGETNWNVKKLLQGQADQSLNDFGRSLAVKTKAGLDQVEFHKVYSSPLLRAYETAEIIVGDRKIEIENKEQIKEISFGVYEGLCCAPEGFNIPDKDFNDFFFAPEKYKTPENGESILSFWNRLGAFLEEIFQNPSLQNKTILVSSHGAAIRGMLSIIKGYDISKFWEGGVQKNCAISIVDYDGEKPIIIEEGRVLYDDEVKEYIDFNKKTK